LHHAQKLSFAAPSRFVSLSSVEYDPSSNQFLNSRIQRHKENVESRDPMAGLNSILSSANQWRMNVFDDSQAVKGGYMSWAT
jgi:hypothetical protein